MDELGAEVLEALRGYVVAYQDSSRDLAHHMGLPVPDGVGLGEVLYAEQRGAPLSPTALSHRIALTSGATNALVNRLETRGLVTRSREHEDRRIVSLRATAVARSRAEQFFGPSRAHLAQTLDGYERDRLVIVRDALRELAAVLPRAR
ncbi:MarR family winged helix-turn-helix transcriptional regulator [Nocardioides litoris]|uniref:MarR family winged helix-turn-helix transcriptional regulator n=1 Tax=Nocardioides litoris TaxID=1926648 RepID=UPI001B86E3E3|nr:MarR family transcriptional regulator [Nocardioides litoris]